MIFVIVFSQVLLLGVHLAIASTVGEPLLLTPLLKSGNVDEARTKSEVHPFLPNIFSNSGFFTVNETTNSNLFFWFFRKSGNDWRDAPVLLWLHGGPGCGFMFAVFTENGPYTVTRGKLKRKKYSWTNMYNVLFIDNPVNSGFSFSNNYYVRTQEESGENVYEALIQFYHLYPELRNNRFFITGESYAGKFAPTLAHIIYKKSFSHGEFQINLKGVVMGNGYSDPENMQEYVKHVHQLGFIDYKTKLRLETKESETRALIHSGLWKRACLGRENLLKEFKNITEYTELLNYLVEKDVDRTYIDFLNSPKVRNAIHVGNITFDDCSKEAYDQLREDIPQSVKPQVEELLEEYQIMLYSGQTDLTVPHFVVSKFVEELQWSGASGFSVTPKKKWFIGNNLVGYYKGFDNLKYAFVRNAGHMPPTQQPKAMLDLLDKFINGDQ